MNATTFEQKPRPSHYACAIIFRTQYAATSRLLLERSRYSAGLGHLDNHLKTTCAFPLNSYEARKRAVSTILRRRISIKPSTNQEQAAEDLLHEARLAKS